MAQQTVYANNPAPAFNGQVAPQEGTVIWSKVASGNVPIGLLATFGTQSLSAPGATTSLPTTGNAGQVIALGAGISDNPILDSEFIGVPIFDAALMQSSQVTTVTTGTFSVSAYVDQITVPVLRKGVIWVLADAATTQFNDVYVYVTAQTNNPRGQFGALAGTGKVKFTRGRWLMTTTGAGLSLLEVW